jgi:hypothetical protein
MMSRESTAAGTLLTVFPAVMYGGLSLLLLLTGKVPGYNDNPVRHDLWRAGAALSLGIGFFRAERRMER